jgi:hypothetical protein
VQPTLLHHQLKVTVAAEASGPLPPRAPSVPRVRPALARGLRVLASRLEPSVPPAPTGAAVRPPARPAHRPAPATARRPACRPRPAARAVGRPRRGGPP